MQNGSEEVRINGLMSMKKMMEMDERVMRIVSDSEVMKRSVDILKKKTVDERRWSDKDRFLYIIIIIIIITRGRRRRRRRSECVGEERAIGDSVVCGGRRRMGRRIL